MVQHFVFLIIFSAFVVEVDEESVTEEALVPGIVGKKRELLAERLAGGVTVCWTASLIRHISSFVG
ncbi:MAG: hypothetical protein ACK4PR_09555, partial [Gammaproteobacteria bacterium]